MRLSRVIKNFAIAACSSGVEGKPIAISVSVLLLIESTFVPCINGRNCL
jgi:hypothetical protein